MGSVRTTPRLLIAVLLTAVAVTGCAGANDYYSHDPYGNDAKIDEGLAAAERQFAELMTAGQTHRVLLERTAPPWRKRMQLFVRRYARHPAVIERTTPGDDATADEELSVTCPHGDVQSVTVTWGWFDGARRAWPDYRLTATGRAVDYPGCR